MLRNAGTLMLGINIQGYHPTNDVGGWRIALSCLNRSLHNLYCHIKATKIRRIELTIRYVHVSPRGLVELQQLLSPAMAVAASVSESTFSLNHPWPMVHNADEAEWHAPSPDPQAFRGLLSALRDLREEASVFNKLHTMFLHRNKPVKKCPTVESEFESHWRIRGYHADVYRLRYPSSLQATVDRAKVWLELRESADFEEGVQACVRNLEMLKTARAARQAERTEQTERMEQTEQVDEKDLPEY